MAHFAKIDENNIVVTVLVVPDEQEHRGQEYLNKDIGLEGRWIQTSYNSHKGVHYNQETWTPSGKPALRKNFAGTGFYYDETLDAFIPPKPEGMNSFILDSETCSWIPPIPKPEEVEGPYDWNEETVSWDLCGSPYPSWSWDYENKKWKAPVLCPGDEWNYWWDEEKQSWIEYEEMI